jgi:hypothetical protein
MGNGASREASSKTMWRDLARDLDGGFIADLWVLILSWFEQLWGVIYLGSWLYLGKYLAKLSVNRFQ